MFKKFLYVTVFLTMSGASGLAQIYRVYRPETIPVYAEEKQLTNVYESRGLAVELGGTYSWGTIKDREGYVLNKTMQGISSGLWIPIFHTVRVGVRGEMSEALHQETEFLDKIKRESIFGQVEFTLTPHTRPALYMRGGVGYKRYQSKFKLQQHTLDQGGLAWLAGMGIRNRLWKRLEGSLEYDYEFETEKWKNFVLTGPRGRHNIRAQLTYQF